MVTINTSFHLYIESFLYEKKGPLALIITFVLSPLMLLYCAIITYKKWYATSHTQHFTTPIISIGNLTVGGNGKTPVTITLAKQYQKSAIILRGYGRQSKGLKVVRTYDKILGDVHSCGDEAMEYALALNSLVIVSADRVLAIQKAIHLGAKIIFLDDGFSKYSIEKFNILIKPSLQPYTKLCLPCGAYREPYSMYKSANFILEESTHIKRKTVLKNPTDKMILITAIARASRLDPYLPELVAKYSFPDHHFFTYQEIVALVTKHEASSIVCTQKDAVKLEAFGFALSILELDITLSDQLFEKIDLYANRFN